MKSIYILRVIEKVIAQGIIQSKLVLGSSSEMLSLTVNDVIVIKPIVYLAFEKVLESRGFSILQRRIKRDIPKIEIGEENMKRGLITFLTRMWLCSED